MSKRKMVTFFNGYIFECFENRYLRIIAHIGCLIQIKYSTMIVILIVTVEKSGKFWKSAIYEMDSKYHKLSILIDRC